jgi:hypothetical protein
MKDVSTFLAEITESRRREQAEARSGFVMPSDLSLPPALEVALSHRFLLTPVLARSALALNSARAGVPSRERDQIEYWFSLYGDDANWIIETGEAGVFSLEIDLRLARYSLAHFAGDDRSWQRSLHFAACGKWHVLFEYAAEFPSLRGYPGLSLHSGDSILVPPSRTPSGIELVYAAPHAPLLSADWLRKAALLR